MHGATLIEKEEIQEFKFLHEEVLKNAEEIKYRQEELLRATSIGNNHHSKVKLIFETEDGLKEVETTVWAATDKYVTLKGGVMIPVHTIKQVFIY